MTKKESLRMFDDRSICLLWDDEQEEWYFSIIDVVTVLTDSVNATTY